MPRGVGAFKGVGVGGGRRENFPSFWLLPHAMVSAAGKLAVEWRSREPRTLVLISGLALPHLSTHRPFSMPF